MAVDATPHEIPGVRTLDFVTHPHAAGAQNTPIMIDTEPVVRGIDLIDLVSIRHADMIHSAFLSQPLEIAIAVGNTHRADVIPFGK